MDREFRKWMSWFGKTHKPYKVSYVKFMTIINYIIFPVTFSTHFVCPETFLMLSVPFFVCHRKLERGDFLETKMREKIQSAGFVLTSFPSIF